MRTALAAFALVLVPAAAAATPPFGSQWATAVADPARPAARAVLTVTLHYPMTCGQPGRGPVVVTLPTALKRPIVRTDVLVAGKAPPSLDFFGRTVTIGLPKPPEIICQSIAQGTLRIRFTAAAGLTNPAKAGSYLVTAHIGNRTFHPHLAIR